MALSMNPTTFFPDLAADVTEITIPRSSFVDAFNAEDMRAMLHAILNKVHVVWASYDPINYPTNMELVKTTVWDDTKQKLKHEFKVTFFNDILEEAVADEPEA